MRNPEQKTRGFVITNFNCNPNKYDHLVKCGKFQFLAYGDETCPTTGKKHHQVFGYTPNPLSYKPRNLNRIGKLFGETQCHVEPMHGSFVQNEAYCSKESQLVKIGDEPKQGFRGDLKEIRDMVMTGNLTSDQVAIEDPGTFHMYGRTIERLETIALRKKWRTEMTEGIWITGPSHSGKSHEAFDNFHPDTHFMKVLEDQWWDGYKGQEIVIFNEFRGEIGFSELLALVDKWPHSVRIRGKEPVPFLAKKLIVTSVWHPKSIYWQQTGEPWEQFERRFKIVTKNKRKLGE